MSATAAKKKKSAGAAAEQPSSASQVMVINGLLDGYDFIAKNEYAEETIGIQAFLMRKGVGDINFSELIDESEKRSRQGQTSDFGVLLDERRRALQEIDASIEKCLMINRLSIYVNENTANFTKTLSQVRLGILSRLNDGQTNRNVQYPADFRQRERDFCARKSAQEKRRLFYFSQNELHPLENLVNLQNRTTSHLRFVIEQIVANPKSCDSWMKELETIIAHSFMIVAQPHSGVNPTTIYERKGPGQYGAKISVCIISLLHDFMQQYPKLIQLYDIEPSLCPTVDYYKLEEPRSLPWNTCQVQTATDDKTRTFHCANLNYITIEQASKTDTRVRFAQELHTFKFAIKLQINLANSKMPPVYTLSLQSLPFAIGAHNNQISHLLTRVIFDDIRRFSQSPMVDVRTMHQYLQRYFIHRTGVRMNTCGSTNLEQELTRAQGRGQHQRIDEMYMDFVVNFVHQVEFMAKHPILAMFHADGLFLGICNSERAAEAIIQVCTAGSPAIGLRFNAIRLENSSPSTLASGNKTVKLNQCAVRVDIYNHRTKKLQNRTFDSGCLPSDISKFIASAHTSNVEHILLLSNFDDKTNSKPTLPFSTFNAYYHDRLLDISKTDEKYKPVTDLVDNATNGNTEENDAISHNGDDASSVFPFGPNSVSAPLSMTASVFDADQNLDETSNQDYASIPGSNSQLIFSPLPSVASPPNQVPTQPLQYMNQQAFVQMLCSQPDLVQEFMRRSGIYDISNPILSSPPQPQTQPQHHQRYQQQPQEAQSQYQPLAPQVYAHSVQGNSASSLAATLPAQPRQAQSPYQPLAPQFYPSSMQGNSPPSPATALPAQNQHMYQQNAMPYQQFNPRMQHQYPVMSQMQSGMMPPSQQQYFQPPQQQQPQQQPIRPSAVIHHHPSSNNRAQVPQNLMQTVNNTGITPQRLSNQVETLNVTADEPDSTDFGDFSQMSNLPGTPDLDDFLAALNGDLTNQLTFDARPLPS